MANWWNSRATCDSTGCGMYSGSMAWCGATNNNCVEAATNLSGLVAVRDSKDPAGPALAFSPAAWSEFLAGVRNGDFCPKRDHGRAAICLGGGWPRGSPFPEIWVMKL